MFCKVYKTLVVFFKFCHILSPLIFIGMRVYFSVKKLHVKQAKKYMRFTKRVLNRILYLFTFVSLRRLHGSEWFCTREIRSDIKCFERCKAIYFKTCMFKHLMYCCALLHHCELGISFIAVLDQNSSKYETFT